METTWKSSDPRDPRDPFISWSTFPYSVAMYPKCTRDPSWPSMTQAQVCSFLNILFILVKNKHQCFNVRCVLEGAPSVLLTQITNARHVGRIHPTSARDASYRHRAWCPRPAISALQGDTSVYRDVRVDAFWERDPNVNVATPSDYKSRNKTITTDVTSRVAEIVTFLNGRADALTQWRTGPQGGRPYA